MESRVDSSENYFALFGLPVAYGLDVQALGPLWRQLQQQHHPDRFSHDASAQAQAELLSSRINAAHETLRDPVRRARYLLELAGHGIDNESTTVSDTDFLMAQMDLREQLDDAESIEGLDGLRDEVGQWQASLQREFALDYAEPDWPEAQDTVRKMQFMQRLLSEIDRHIERLEDEQDL